MEPTQSYITPTLSQKILWSSQTMVIDTLALANIFKEKENPLEKMCSDVQPINTKLAFAIVNSAPNWVAQNLVCFSKYLKNKTLI